MEIFKYQTLRENAADLIRQMILEQVYQPGERIKEQEIAQKLGISRGPIREALRQLEQEGMVEYVRNAGCSVKKVSVEDAYEIYMLRASYEALAVQVCGGEFPDETFRTMEEMLEKMKNLKEGDSSLTEYDNCFHESIVRLSEFPRLIKSWSDLGYGNTITCYVGNSDIKTICERQYRLHYKLYEACKTRNANTICKAVFEHYLLSVDKAVPDSEHFRHTQDLLGMWD